MDLIHLETTAPITMIFLRHVVPTTQKILKQDKIAVLAVETWISIPFTALMMSKWSMSTMSSTVPSLSKLVVTMME
jgi:hypothetical protein